VKKLSSLAALFAALLVGCSIPAELAGLIQVLPSGVPSASPTTAATRSPEPSPTPKYGPRVLLIARTDYTPTGSVKAGLPEPQTLAEYFYSAPRALPVKAAHHWVRLLVDEGLSTGWLHKVQLMWGELPIGQPLAVLSSAASDSVTPDVNDGYIVGGPLIPGFTTSGIGVQAIVPSTLASHSIRIIVRVEAAEPDATVVGSPASSKLLAVE